MRYGRTGRRQNVDGESLDSTMKWVDVEDNLRKVRRSRRYRRQGVAEDNVASSVHRRRAGSVTFMKSGKAGSVKPVKSNEVGPVKNCERGTGQYTDSSAWSGTLARTEKDRP